MTDYHSSALAALPLAQGLAVLLHMHSVQVGYLHPALVVYLTSSKTCEGGCH